MLLPSRVFRHIRWRSLDYLCVVVGLFWGKVGVYYLSGFFSAATTKTSLSIFGGFAEFLPLVYWLERVLLKHDSTFEQLFVDISLLLVGKAEFVFQVHDLALQRLQLRLHHRRSMVVRRVRSLVLVGRLLHSWVGIPVCRQLLLILCGGEISGRNLLLNQATWHLITLHLLLFAWRRCV